MKLLQTYKAELIRRKYSDNTVKVYLNMFGIFIKYFAGKDIRYISDINIKQFLLDTVNNGASISYQNQLINSIKFYYEKVLNRPKKTYYINRPIKEKRLPVLLSQNEICCIIKQIKNLKHKAIFYLLYSCGLRVSEIINIKISNVDSERMIINIIQAKGKKDRQVPLSNNVLKILREYYKLFKPTEYLFNGQSKPKYSAKSIQKFLQSYAIKAGIKKRIYPHLIRHCSFTHMMEEGTDINIIQKIAGHSNVKTTMVYAHLSTSFISGIKTPDQFLKI